MGLANGVPFGEVVSPCAFNQDLKAIVPNTEVILARFMAHALRQQSEYFMRAMETAAHGTLKINSDTLRAVRIPLPDLATQAAIVAEIEAEQALVNGNRDLIDRLTKKIDAAIARVWREAKGEKAA